MGGEGGAVAPYGLLGGEGKDEGARSRPVDYGGGERRRGRGRALRTTGAIVWVCLVLSIVFEYICVLERCAIGELEKQQHNERSKEI